MVMRKVFKKILSLFPSFETFYLVICFFVSWYCSSEKSVGFSTYVHTGIFSSLHLVKLCIMVIKEKLN